MAKPTQKSGKHPSRKQLSDFINGLLDARYQTAIEKHVSKCQSCCEKLIDVDGGEFESGDTLDGKLKEIATRLDSLPFVKSTTDDIPDELLSLDRYEIIERIATGGMGDVYRARQKSMGREVAVKALRRHLFENDRAIARFQNEVRVAAKLNHPNIVHSYDADFSDGINLLVMELVDGKPLSEFVRQNQRVSVSTASQIAIQIAEGLQYAVGQGTIHRDIKPHNVLIQKDGSIKITDFGLAKYLLDSSDDGNRGLTTEGETFGTPDYIAPEQIRNSASADLRADIYSLGCTLYFMVTGQPPFAEASAGEKLVGHLEKTPAPMASVSRANIPPGFTNLVGNMMSKQPENRLQDYDAVISALKPFVDLPDDEDFAPSFLKSRQRQETAVDLEPPPKKIDGSSNKNVGSKRRNMIVAIAAFAGFMLLGFGLKQFLFPPTPEKTHHTIAVVVPSKNAFHPEVNGLHSYLTNQPNVKIVYVADQKGIIEFSMRNRNRPQPIRANADKTISDLDMESVDAVVFTGGWNGTDASDTAYAFDSAKNKVAGNFIRQMIRANKPVGSVCGGTAVLAKSGLLKGKRAANCRYIESDVKNESGAIWSPELSRDQDGIVVQDGLIITGGNFINCEEICEKILSHLTSN